MQDSWFNPLGRQLPARRSPLVAAAIGGLLAYILLGLVSAANGSNPAQDPPPRMSQWVLEDDSNPHESKARDRAKNERPSRAAADVLEAPRAVIANVGYEPLAAASGAGTNYRQATVESARHFPSPGGPPPLIEPIRSPSGAVEAPLAFDNDAAPMEDLWQLPKLFRPDVYPRHQGTGEPLLDSSWLNRPYYAGFFVGGLDGDTLIADEIEQSIGFFGGVRFGWDYDTYWGVEMRLAFSELGLDFIDRPSLVGLSNDVILWDASLVYYPWGDARWRPYLAVGIGLVDFDFLDADALRHSDAVVGVPWGTGLKYRQSDWITLRCDLTDNVAFGGKSGFGTMNNISLTLGAEFRFGGTRWSYFPWNPSRTIR